MRSTYLIETIVYLSKFSSFATSYLGKVLLYARLFFVLEKRKKEKNAYTRREQRRAGV